MCCFATVSPETDSSLQASTLWGAVVWEASSHGHFRKLESTPHVFTNHLAGTALGHGEIEMSRPQVELLRPRRSPHPTWVSAGAEVRLSPPSSPNTPALNGSCRASLHQKGALLDGCEEALQRVCAPGCLLPFLCSAA